MFFVVLTVYLVLLFFKTRNVEYRISDFPKQNLGECDGDEAAIGFLQLVAAIAENKEFYTTMLKTLGNSRLRNDLIKTIPNERQYRRIQRTIQQIDRRLKENCINESSLSPSQAFE
tara:strand:+ start:2978 stop:3325 length:348 start_codon:yes stop_codon:yes gene_type:complete